MSAFSSMTIADLKLRIAEEVAIHAHDPATGKRIAPTQIEDKDRIDRALRYGYAEFCDVRPWIFMRTVVEFGVQPDAGIDANGVRYAAPSGMSMGIIDTTVPFASAAGHGSDADVVDAMTVRRHQIYRGAVTGAPTLLAVGRSTRIGAVPSAVTDREGRGGLEIIIWPKPDQAYTGLFETNLRPPLPVDDQARGFWPAVHDLTIAAYAAREFIRGGDAANAPSMSGIQQRVAERLSISIAADNALAEVHKPMPGTRSGRIPKGVSLSNESQVILGG